VSLRNKFSVFVLEERVERFGTSWWGRKKLQIRQSPLLVVHKDKAKSGNQLTITTWIFLHSGEEKVQRALITVPYLASYEVSQYSSHKSLFGSSTWLADYRKCAKPKVLVPCRLFPCHAIMNADWVLHVTVPLSDSLVFIAIHQPFYTPRPTINSDPSFPITIIKVNRCVIILFIS